MRLNDGGEDKGKMAVKRGHHENASWKTACGLNKAYCFLLLIWYFSKTLVHVSFFCFCVLDVHHQENDVCVNALFCIFQTQ